MASVAFDRTVTKTPLLSDVQGFSPRSEAFRLLRTNLQYLDLDSQPKSLVITSPMPAEGKTSTSTNLARSEEHTSELQSLMRISYAVFCWKKQNNKKIQNTLKT